MNCEWDCDCKDHKTYIKLCERHQFIFAIEDEGKAQIIDLAYRMRAERDAALKEVQRLTEKYERRTVITGARCLHLTVNQFGICQFCGEIIK
jgi:hypothetical protein